MSLIYKIMTEQEWEETAKLRIFSGSALDRKDGFIHFSTPSQVVETAARHFVNRGILILVAVDATSMAENLRFEPSRGGELFPHLYVALKYEDIVSVSKFNSDDLDSLRKLVAE